MEFERTTTKVSDSDDAVGTTGEIIREKVTVELTEDEAKQMIDHYLTHDGFSREGKWDQLKDVGTVTEIKKERTGRGF